MKVEDIMAREVISLDKDDELESALEIIKKGYTKIPVLDEGKFVGLVTDGEIAEKLGSIRTRNVLLSKLHVSSVMVKDVPTVSPNLPVEDILKTVGLPGPTMLPVIYNKKLVGVVTKADLLPYVKSTAPVEWIMTNNAKCVAEDDRIIHARRMMVEGDIQRLPVHREGKLVGIISESEIALALALFKKTVPVTHQAARIKELVVGDFMRKDVISAPIGMPIKWAAELMLKQGVGCLPVVDPAGKIVGILSRTDVVRTIGNEPKGPAVQEPASTKRKEHGNWQISQRRPQRR
ncbi:MAG: CBS domain-containing protein [Candidatus Thermoplasmatota archaeon]|nr:CBS domain-containing protein [Candidatus Thermoplasmatota archaeon]